MQFNNMSISLVIILANIIASLAASVDPPIAKPNCNDHCGDLRIPFPFGTSEDCFLNDEFFVHCNQSKAYLRRGQRQIIDISLDGQMRILQSIAKDCYGRNHTHHNDTLAWIDLLAFTVNNTANKFTVVGCDTYGLVSGQRLRNQNFTTGCTAMCDSMADLENGSCTGLGCCQTSFPKQVRKVDLKLRSYNNYSKVGEFNDCGYAFVAEIGAFSFSPDNITNLKNQDKLPVLIDWEIGNVTSCDEAKKNVSSFACRSVNSECYKPDNGDGYRCSCLPGYQGNPYLDQGCQDVDECQDPNNGCQEERCKNTLGSYECFCPKGYHGDGKRDGKGCNRGDSVLLRVVAGVSFGVVVLLLSACWLYLEMQRRKQVKTRQRFFLQNGGKLLQERIFHRQSSSTTVRIFSATELHKATNSFHNDMIIGQGGHGTVYKGLLPDDNKVVAIKKSKIVDPNEIDQFINEVVVLSQINHRNVVKLLGCCLETEAPLLVYEYISNGSLYELLHNKPRPHPLSWDIRLRLAAETAGVLSYLHSAASVPIIHRDVKTANILLDHTFTAKVSDFGASRLVPLDQTQLSTLVQGTFGYLDPEYMQTQQLTEKSDVYSFGVVLLELLTGRKAVRRDGPEEERSLANFFLNVMKEEGLFQIVEKNVMRGSDKEVVMKVAVLAERCVNVKGEERPLMKEVAMELEGLLVGENYSSMQTHSIAREEQLFVSNSNTGSSISTIGFDSVKDHIIMSVGGGR